MRKTIGGHGVVFIARLAALFALTGDDDPERGDVPGWVMITLMSAVLVAGMLAVSGPTLVALFQAAISQVAP